MKRLFLSSYEDRSSLNFQYFFTDVGVRARHIVNDNSYLIETGCCIQYPYIKTFIKVHRQVTMCDW